MKKLLLSLASFFICSHLVFSQNGQIMNGGFEMWNTNVLSENPATWLSSNQEFGQVSTVLKSTDAQHQSYSAKLINVVANNDTLFGYVVLGSIGNMGPDGGIPYSANCDRVNGYYKSSLVTGDTAFAIVIKFLMGNPTSFDIVPLANGVHSSWTSFSLPLTAGPQDSLFVGFVNGNPFGSSAPNPSSWIMLDNISMGLSTGGTLPALPNFSFETWNAITDEDPVYWNSLDPLIASTGISTVSKTTASQSGSFAAEITTRVLPSNDTIPGFLTTGAFDPSNFMFIPIPYTAEPTTFSGAYKYAPAAGSSATIMIEFYWNGIIVGAHYENITGVHSAYTNFSASLSISATPDSALLVIYAGDNPGAKITVDNLSLSGGNVSVMELAKNMNLTGWPNPADDHIWISFDNENSGEVIITITDIQGKTVQSLNPGILPSGENKMQLDVSSLDPGIYFCKVQSGNNSYVLKFTTH